MTAPMQIPAGRNFNMGNPFFGLLPKEFKDRRKEFFIYNIIINDLDGGEALSDAADVQGDSDFAWVLASAVITDDTLVAQSATPPLTVKITDGSSGLQLQDQVPMAIENVFGNSMNPLVLPIPRIFRAGGQIVAEVENFSTNVNNLVVSLAFIGFKVYR